MASAWNTTYFTQDDVFDIEFLRMVWTAYWERFYAQAATPPYPTPPLPESGTCIPVATNPSNPNGTAASPSVGATNFSPRALQLSLETICTRFIQVGYELPGPRDLLPFTGPGQARYNVAVLRSMAGIHADGFIRKRPREIASLAATADLQGNARQVGQVAWFNGRLYRYDSGTQWVSANPGDVPDVLSSDQAAPNRIAYGYFLSGDYYGPHLYEQLRDVMNVMTRTWLPQGGVNLLTVDGSAFNRMQCREGISSQGVSEEDGRAEAEADYLGSPPITSTVFPSSLTYFPGTVWIGTNGSYTTGSFPTRVVWMAAVNFKMGTPGHFQGRPSVVDLYLRFGLYPYEATFTEWGPRFKFNANDTGMDSAIWNPYQSFTVPSSGDWTFTPLVGDRELYDLDRLPTWGAEVVPGSFAQQHGIFYDQATGYATWDFEYGPTT